MFELNAETETAEQVHQYLTIRMAHGGDGRDLVTAALAAVRLFVMENSDREEDLLTAVEQLRTGEFN